MSPKVLLSPQHSSMYACVKINIPLAHRHHRFAFLESYGWLEPSPAEVFTLSSTLYGWLRRTVTLRSDKLAHMGAVASRNAWNTTPLAVSVCVPQWERFGGLSHHMKEQPRQVFFCFGKKNQIDHRIRHLSEGKTKVKGGVSDATIFSVNYFKRGFVKSTFKLHIFHWLWLTLTVLQIRDVFTIEKG